ncbi:hypothetical protein LWI28_014281 [Acer negundo]|uniref:Dynein light chain n=1 Tax=Acer negundo TaxID=4023 RepID=A0AAD5JIW6_ACENE|nr:hypothetical protein LWI28_014281 [Acer negundo]KAK4853524.1 hypothetical protein QYF36_010574 [Acer negundo]
MATKGKPKKLGFMSFYNKYSTNKTQKPKPDPVDAVSHSWQQKKPENCPELEAGFGGRRSVCEGRKSVSSVETNLGSVIGFLQVKVLVSDMPPFMQAHAFRCARTTYDSLEKFSSKHIAYNMKKEFDKVYGPAWHCIVGSSFGSFVTHSTGCFLYFQMEKLYILLFKTKVLKLNN